MKRRKFLQVSTAAVAATGLAASKKKPNIILFYVDDLGWMDLGCQGSKLYETPNIDRLAKEGVRYTQGYTPHPRCLPARYGVITGRFPARGGVPGGKGHLQPDDPTMADALRKDVDKHVKSTLSDISGGTHPTPDEVMEGAPDEVTRELVYEVARAHVYDGARNTEVMDRTHATLADTYSDLTREQVSQLFTDYGRQTRLTPGEEAKALRDARSLELVQKQIDGPEFA